MSSPLLNLHRETMIEAESAVFECLEQYSFRRGLEAALRIPMMGGGSGKVRAFTSRCGNKTDGMMVFDFSKFAEQRMPCVHAIVSVGIESDNATAFPTMTVAAYRFLTTVSSDAPANDSDIVCRWYGKWRTELVRLSPIQSGIRYDFIPMVEEACRDSERGGYANTDTHEGARFGWNHLVNAHGKFWGSTDETMLIVAKRLRLVNSEGDVDTEGAEIHLVGRRSNNNSEQRSDIDVRRVI